MVRGRKRDLSTARKVEAEVSASIHNRFDVEVIDARTGEIRQRAQAENVICEQLWTRLLKPDSYFNYIHYGSGDGTPAAMDTSLFHFVGSLTPNSYYDDEVSADGATGTAYRRRKVQLAENVAVGITITEVGIAYSTNSSSLVTHAMLRDMNGNQISIEKSNTDIVNIYATVYAHWNPIGYNGVYVIPYIGMDGIAYPSLGFLGYLTGIYVTYNANINARPPSVALPCLGCQDNAMAGKNVSSLAVSYDITAKEISLTATRFSIAAGNIGGIVGIVLCGSATDRGVGINPAFYLEAGGDWFPSSTITGEAVGTGDGVSPDFKTAFPFPENAIVYVDGVAQQGVAVEKTILTNDIGAYMMGICPESTPNYIIPYPRAKFNGSNSHMIGGGEQFYYNPYYAFIGIDEVFVSAYTVYASNNNSDWIPIVTKGTVNVPAEYRNYPFWKFDGSSSKYAHMRTNDANGFNIHFPTPPPAGAVITADYTTKCIAKDANHVFDLTVTIHLGEYQA